MTKVIGYRFLVFTLSVLNLILLVKFFDFEDGQYLLYYCFIFFAMQLLEYRVKFLEIDFVYRRTNKSNDELVDKILKQNFEVISSNVFSKFLYNIANYDIRQFERSKIASVVCVLSVLYSLVSIIILLEFNLFTVGLIFILFILILIFAICGVNKLNGIYEMELQEEFLINEYMLFATDSSRVISTNNRADSDHLKMKIKSMNNELIERKKKILLHADFIYNLSSVLSIILLGTIFLYLDYNNLGLMVLLIQFMLKVITMIEELSDYSFNILKEIKRKRAKYDVDFTVSKNETYKMYDKHAKKINEMLEKEKKIVITGRNGSGKSSTLINLVETKKITKEYGLLFDSTATTKIAVLQLLEVKKYEIFPELEFILDAGKASNDYSGGEIQKINLEYLFLKKQQLYIMDEPIEALDYEGKQQFIKYLNENIERFIIITHNDITNLSVDFVHSLQGESDV